MAIILTARYIEPLWGAAVPMPARTPATYRDRQRVFLAMNPAAVAPYEVTEPTAAFIGGGKWRVHCRCGEAPHTDPEWGLSCCFGCGAVHTSVVFPPDWPAIETLLAKRPVMATRNWAPPETLEELRAEQIAHGDPT